jgi:hypothetical protein
MKIGTIVLSAVVLAATVGSLNVRAGDLGNPAQALTTMSRTQIEHAKKSYLQCLESNNEGVIQSTIGIVLQWRLINPQEDLSRLERKINDLALVGRSPAIRFKASLASLAIDNPTIVKFDVAACDDCCELFDAITGSVRQMLIGHMLY